MLKTLPILDPCVAPEDPDYRPVFHARLGSQPAPSAKERFLALAARS
jgi:hypothetical protein